jgi:hypothetical protein
MKSKKLCTMVILAVAVCFLLRISNSPIISLTEACPRDLVETGATA